MPALSELNAAEEAIAQYLSEHLPWAQTYRFSGNAEKLGQPVSRFQIFVGYRRERLGEPPQTVLTAPLTQTRTIEFELVLRGKDLRTQANVLEYIDEIRDLLSGFLVPIPRSKRLYMTSGGFVSVDGGIWVYSMVFSCPCPYVKDFRFSER